VLEFALNGEKEVGLSATGQVGRLLPSERQRFIRQLALERSVLKVSELAREFGVSEMTIRRDLSLLARAGHLEKTFGGAVVVEQAASELSYKVRLETNQMEKNALGELAAGMIQDGDTIAIDASTTGLALARKLAQRELTIVTNSLDIAFELRVARPQVILTGGVLRQTAGSLVGPLALEALGHLRVDQAFFSCKGVVIPDGFMESDLSETEVKRKLLACAARVTALVDASKFGKRALSYIVGLSQVDALITDSGVSSQVIRRLREHGVKTHVAEVSR
jgi:DeoR/GlpR family transcriptional regulator of sugar metabolism